MLLEALKKGRLLLEDSAIPEAALESEILLRHSSRLSLVGLILNYKKTVPPEMEKHYFEFVARRVGGEPSAYITGQKEFYGLSYYVNHDVLIPRPETELLVEKALESASEYKYPVVTDIGTGSGAVAVALAKNMPLARILAGDISPSALELAEKNADLNDVSGRIRFHCADLLSFLTSPVDVIVANLPYVPSSCLPDSTEPRTALDGGENGLDIISRFCAGIYKYLKPGGVVLLEIGRGQAGSVCKMLKRELASSDIAVYRDLAGIRRVVRARSSIAGNYRTWS